MADLALGAGRDWGGAGHAPGSTTSLEARFSSGDTRWRVTFAPDLMAARSITFAAGELLLRQDALRLVLLDDRGSTVDARSLRIDEMIDIRAPGGGRRQAASGRGGDDSRRDDKADASL
ncbi:hypothetical protein VPH35_058609 [Triticum aestivum]|uniref:uncharacterized protein n=1 Tax=Triticum aestivum TaxID=4565 RepID=UPI001ABC4932|nr:uncharacterized protein LOC123074178 [Triticum aestivum]